MKQILFILFVMNIVAAKTVQVVDQQTGNGLPGVNITIVGTSDGLNTDLDGYFLLDDSYVGQSLKFSYIGYIDTTLNYSDISNVRKIQLSPDVLNLSSVEVISSKLEWEQADLPSLVTTVRTRDLVNQGSIELKEALQRDPSVVVEQGYSGTHEISIRGSNADEVLIIYDGIPLNSSYLGGFDLSWLNLNDIESLSIIKGAGTLKYGSGAFGGVVVLDPIRKGGTGFNMNYQTTDQNLKSYSLSDITQIGPLHARLTYSSKETLPFGFFNSDITAKRDFLNFYSTYALMDTANYFSFNYMDIREDVDPFPQLESNYADRYAQVKYHGKIGLLNNMIVQLMQRNNTSEEQNITDPAFEFSNETEEETQLASLENKLVLKNLVNLFKVELKQDIYTGKSNTRNVFWERDDNHHITLSQDWYALTDVFKYRSEIEVPFVDYIELNTSFRYDNIKLNKIHKAYWDGDIYIDSDSTDIFDQISRRSGFTLQKNRKNFRYQMFYTSGTNLRYPSMYDIYLRDHTTIYRYADSPLKPELIFSTELGLQASIQPSNPNSIFGTIDIQASVYKNKYNDKIYHTSIPRALPTPLNMISTELSGKELSVMASLFQDRMRVFIGTHRLDISSYTIFPNKPKFRDVAEIEFHNPRGNLRVQYFHEGKQYFGGTQDNINWVVQNLRGRENVNLYGSMNLKVAQKEYIIGVSLLNQLSDEDELNYFNQRKWLFNLGLSF